MKLSAGITFWMSLLFATLTLGYGLYGYIESSSMTAGQDHDDARGFAMFWMFLGTIGVVMAVVSWRMMRDSGERR